jgi:Arc/MetJ-type ribon-helix-helix transcriptional regulator
MDAFLDSAVDAGNYYATRSHQIAAALRAAADQVVPEEPLYGGDQRWEWERDARQASRKKILAIATELEDQP